MKLRKSIEKLDDAVDNQGNSIREPGVRVGVIPIYRKVGNRNVKKRDFEVVTDLVA